MGSFEKLGILVIVVIIVMILAVAIHQWGDSVDSSGFSTQLTVVDPAEDGKFPVDRDPQVLPHRGDARADDRPAADADTWADGTPRSYQIKEGDSLWVLVVRRWGLAESFIQEVKRANPGLDPDRLRPGTKLTVPDPGSTGGRARAAASQDSPAPAEGAVRLLSYEVQEGDTLESVAKRYLGATWRWPRIVEQNEGLDPNRLSVGQKIVVPVR